MNTSLNWFIPALVNQQRGLSHPDARQGRFQPLLEPNVAAFARWYAETMTNTRRPPAMRSETLLEKVTP